DPIPRRELNRAQVQVRPKVRKLGTIIEGATYLLPLGRRLLKVILAVPVVAIHGFLAVWSDAFDQKVMLVLPARYVACGVNLCGAKPALVVLVASDLTGGVALPQEELITVVFALDVDAAVQGF